MNQDLKEITKIFTGNANYSLAEEIVERLDANLGQRELSQFSDGEIRCEVLEHVRDSFVFIIQPTSSPVNDNLMELLILTDAIKRQGVDKIIAIVPYWGYARQDRKPAFTRTPITSRLAADMVKLAGATRFVTVDIHSEQQLGFFSIPSINISASPELVADMWINQFHNSQDVVVVSPDAGGVERARSAAKQLDDAPLAIVDKRRPQANVSEVMHIIGDVKGKRCIIVDDMIDTAGTLCKSARALKENGATYVAAYATHGVFSGAAYFNILHTDELDEIVVTDTIQLSKDMRKLPKVRQISIANLLAETMYRIRNEKSISEMYIGA